MLASDSLATGVSNVAQVHNHCLDLGVGRSPGEPLRMCPHWLSQRWSYRAGALPGWGSNSNPSPATAKPYDSSHSVSRADVCEHLLCSRHCSKFGFSHAFAIRGGGYYCDEDEETEATKGKVTGVESKSKR